MAENFGTGPGPITVGDQTFLVSPLNDDAATAMARWTKAEFKKHSPLQEIVKKLDKIPPQHHAAILKAATEAELRSEPTADERSQLMQTPSAAAYLLWLLAKINHAGLLLKDVEALVNDSNWQKVWTDLNEVAGLKDYEPGKG